MKENFKILKNIKLLYVEDEDSLRDSVSTGLGLFMSDITIACDGKDGLEKFQNGNFDMVVSDIKMPNMDGVQMVKHIKSISPATPVIFTTAFTDTKYLLEAIELGASRYVLKPIDIKLLLENIYVSYLPVYQQIQLDKSRELAIEHSRNSAITNMVRMISHHWRQPLAKINVVASKVKILNDTGDLTGDVVDDSMDSISQYSKSLSKTIEDFKNNLSASRGEVINSCNVIDIALDFFKPAIEDKDIDIQRDCINNGSVDIDQEKFLQVLVHIITNSVEAIEQHDIQNPKICFESCLEDDQLIITIEDNAGGIPENIKDRVFDMYSSTKSLNNRGIGLYFANVIVKEHLNGTISCENVVDENENLVGAKFIIKVKVDKGLQDG